MWRGDGMPAKHPVFCSVLYNYKVRSQLQRQRRLFLNTSHLDVNISAGDISKILKNTVARNDVACIKKIIQRFHTHSGNITGTQPYWTSTWFQFRAIAFYQTYINQITPTIFIQGV